MAGLEGPLPASSSAYHAFGGATADGGASSNGALLDSAAAGADLDLGFLRSYLIALLPPLLNADVGALNRWLFAGRHAANWQQIAAQFARESSTPVIYVNQIRKSDAQLTEDSGSEGQCVDARALHGPVVFGGLER